ncbi:MAG TPA: NAD(P)/FAD-dependent oxidoreductase [Polyangia bacterium]
MIDVAIAGAGPAGVACAVALVRRDPSLRGRVVLFDRARFPRPKPCGGGLTGHAEEAMRALGLELAVPFEAAPRARVTFGALEREVVLGRPVRVVRREEFDASLVAQARALGIEVREATPIDGFRVGADRVEFGAGGRSLEAKILIGADGVGSALRKHLHRERTLKAPGDPRSTPIRLFRLELDGASRWPRDTMLYDFSPMADGLRGYLWIFPAPGGRLNVGLMHYPSQPQSGAALTELLGRHLARFGISLGSAPRGWPAWGYAPSAKVAGNRVLLVGDAAGIDALTGEGIAVGMEQGLIAADAILPALARGDFRFAGYRRALRRSTVGRELAIDRWLARLLYAGNWRRWLSLVLCDPGVLELYAERVCGQVVLADRKRALVIALAKHLFAGGRRARTLASAALTLPSTPPKQLAAATENRVERVEAVEQGSERGTL